MISMSSPGQKSKQTVLVVWAVTASLAALVLANTTLLFFLRACQVSPPFGALEFLRLPEGSIPGRYRFIQDGQERGLITLNPDHSFISPKGDTNPVYRWEITRDALLIQWQSGPQRFTVIERPGVFVSGKGNLRMEKVGPIDGAK